MGSGPPRRAYSLPDSTAIKNSASLNLASLRQRVAVPPSAVTAPARSNMPAFRLHAMRRATASLCPARSLRRRGLLAGVQYTRIDFDSPLARINPNTVGYVGGYYQWPDNWKFTGRLGVQSFGGAQLLNLTPIWPFTQPIVRFDLDRMDDNDNRLFGVTAEISWVPKPAYQLTIRTPLYAVRN
jgi:hypothetical protein